MLIYSSCGDVHLYIGHKCKGLGFLHKPLGRYPEWPCPFTLWALLALFCTTPVFSKGAKPHDVRELSRCYITVLGPK